jgi:Tfp pilus assembly protein PilF
MAFCSLESCTRVCLLIATIFHNVEDNFGPSRLTTGRFRDTLLTTNSRRSLSPEAGVTLLSTNRGPAVGNSFRLVAIPALCFLFCAMAICSFAQMYGQTTGQQPSGQSRTSGAVVVVNVVGEDGGPLSAEVTVATDGDTGGHTDLAGSNGVVRFAGMARGSYVVSARSPGFKEGYGSVDVPSGYGVFNTTVRLSPEPDDSSDASGVVLAPKAKAEYDKGVEQMRAQHYDESEKHLLAAYKLAPGNPDVNDKLGELYLLTKDFAKSENYLLRALSLDPENNKFLTDLGELRLQQRDYPDAAKTLLKAVSVAPGDWFAHWMLGIAYLHANENEKARDEATQAIKLGKGSANDAEYVLGEALAALGSTDEAIRALRTFLKGSPKNSFAPAAEALIAKLQSGGTVSPDRSGAPAAQTASP